MAGTGKTKALNRIGPLAEAHQRLYARIPSFSCKPGCTDCCGPIPMTLWERANVPEPKQGLDCLSCPYRTAVDCSVYPDRPLLCRLFGTIDDDRMRCPHGYGPEKKLTRAEADAIMKEYETLGGVPISGELTMGVVASVVDEKKRRRR